MEQENEFLMKPKIDFAFKELMMNDKARLGFISAVLGIDPADIKETRILNTELRREHADDKLGIIDVHILMVHVLMNNDAEIDTEINLTYMAAWANRALFYASKLVTDQLKKGDDYDKMKKCISISILDFKLFKQEEEYYSCFHLWEDTRHLLYTDRIEFHVIELPKLPELTPEWIESCNDQRMQWAAFLRAERKEDFEMIAKENTYIDEAYKQLQVISQDEEKRWMYRSREKAIRDQLQYIHEAERREQTAREEGWEQGLEKGISNMINFAKKFSHNKEDVIIQVMQDNNISRALAEEKVNRYWDN